MNSTSSVSSRVLTLMLWDVRKNILHCKDRSLTFRGGAGAVRDAGTSLWRAHAMTAERHQAPDDGGLAGSCVTHNDSAASLTAARFSQDLLQTCEEPITANKRCLCGDARDFKQQRFEHDVRLFEWHQSPWTEREQRVKAK